MADLLKYNRTKHLLQAICLGGATLGPLLTYLQATHVDDNWTQSVLESEIGPESIRAGRIYGVVDEAGGPIVGYAIRADMQKVNPSNAIYAQWCVAVLPQNQGILLQR